MSNLWFNFAIEIGFLSLLGILYYFYQKRRLIKFEENKIPLVMNFIFQSCLAEKKDFAQPELDQLIEALDDFLKDKTTSPPIPLLKTYAQSKICSANLKQDILDALAEIES
jgi:hypothetical protein